METALQPITIPQQVQISYLGLPIWAPLVMRGIPLPVRVGEDMQIAPAEIDVAIVKATHALGEPLGEFEVLERCGNVLLTQFVSNARRDPVLPIWLFPLGSIYERAFAKYVRHIAQYRPRHDEAKWWKQAKRLCDRVLHALKDEGCTGQFRIEELVYLTLKLQLALGFPTGRETK